MGVCRAPSAKALGQPIRWVPVTPARAHRPPPAQEGFILIEVLVSAVIVVLVAGAVLTLLSATTRSSAAERQRSQAYAIAQEDQSRLRAMRISELSRLSTLPREVPVNGTKFEVHSSGVYVNDKTATSSCTQEASSADYLRISSEVTWGGMNGNPVVVQSIVSPSNGTVDSSHGTVTISVTKVGEVPIAGVGFSGSGLSATTDANGCVTFPDLAAGEYTLTPSGAVTGLVDENGKAAAALKVKAAAETTTLVPLKYDLPGAIKGVRFTTKPSPTSAPSPTKANSIVASNIGMKEARVFTASGEVPVESIAATSLYPFSSSYAVYAGFCGSDNPNPSGETNPPGAAAMASVNITPGGTAPEVTIQLPALYLTVTKSGAAVSGARVTITDESCHAKRVYTTNASGNQSAVTTGPIEPGLPWGTYAVCASANNRQVTKTGVAVQSLAGGKALALEIPSSGNSGSCP
jgi:Tfp pilus assembly protein PilV